jgi:hypothetical protein
MTHGSVSPADRAALLTRSAPAPQRDCEKELQVD